MLPVSIYPYMNLEDLNLDYILKKLMKLESNVQDFVEMNAIKYADPIQWNITAQYEKNTIVIDPATGSAYLSVRPVPAGIDISRTEYWTEVFNLDAIISNYTSNLTEHDAGDALVSPFTLSPGEWVISRSKLYVVTSAIVPGDQFTEGGNVARLTVEEAIKTIAKLIDDEAATRAAVDNAIGQRITDETAARENNDSALGQRITDEATTREAVDNALGQRITDNTGLIATSTLRTMSHRVFLFIGDSYGDEAAEWPHLVIDALGLTGRATNLCVGGAGFLSSGETQYLFLTQIQNFAGDRNAVTDIVVCGGLNDSQSDDPQAVSYTQIQNNMIAFNDYVKVNYPNATVSLGYIGNGVDGRSGSLIGPRVYATRQACRYIYYNKAAALGWRILENVEYALTGSPALIGDDGVHPSAFGNAYLGAAIAMAILNGSATYTYPKQSAQASAGDLTGNITYSIYNQTAHLNVEVLTKTMTNAAFNSGDTLDLCTLYGLWFNDPLEVFIPVNISGLSVNGAVQVTHLAMARLYCYKNEAKIMIVSGSDQFSGSGAIYVFPGSFEFDSMILA